LPRTRQKFERVPVRIPKPMTDEIDRIVTEYTEYGWNRQRFIETAIAEMIMKVKSTAYRNKRVRGSRGVFS